MREPEEYDGRHRYRIYRVGSDGLPHEIASTETREGIGVALVTLRDEGEWGDHDAIGVRDTEPLQRGPTGRWIVNPYARG